MTIDLCGITFHLVDDVDFIGATDEHLGASISGGHKVVHWGRPSWRWQGYCRPRRRNQVAEPIRRGWLRQERAMNGGRRA